MEKIEIVEKYYPGGETLWKRYETKDGKKHGTDELFYESGKIKIRTEYVEDRRHGTYEQFHESGGIESRIEYVEGKMHGTSEWFHKSGELEYRTEYIEDRRHGTDEEFHESGGIESRTEYAEGKMHGTDEEFYKSGGIESRTEYVEDLRHGTWKWFYESGGIRIRTEYVEGESHGPHKEYNLKGDLVLDIVLENTKQINIKDSLNVVNLDKITDFLDKLPTEKFDFNEVRSECGSKACVVGWFPSIFPEVEYRGNRFKLNMMDGLNYIKAASYMLNVSEKIARDLFSPQDEISKLFPTLPICGDDATLKEVSTRLKAFKELVMAE